MEPKWSEVEVAIHTVVSEFHKACGGSANMNITQFKTMISSQMPTFTQKVHKEQKFPQVLAQMKVKNDDVISFHQFWTLINDETIDLFRSVTPSLERKSSVCSCALL